MVSNDFKQNRERFADSYKQNKLDLDLDRDLNATATSLSNS